MKTKFLIVAILLLFSSMVEVRAEAIQNTVQEQEQLYAYEALNDSFTTHVVFVINDLEKQAIQEQHYRCHLVYVDITKDALKIDQDIIVTDVGKDTSTGVGILLKPPLFIS